MAVAFRTHTRAQISLGSAAVTTPGSVVAGDWALAIMSTTGGAGTSASAPAGWSSVGAVLANPNIGGWFRAYTSAPPATETFTSVSGNDGFVTVFYLSGGDTSGHDGLGGLASGTTTVTLAAVTTSAANAVLCCLAAEKYGANTATFSFTNGVTKVAEQVGTTGVPGFIMALGTKTIASPGGTGTTDATITDTGNFVGGWSIAIKPAAAGDTTPPLVSTRTVNGATLVITYNETLDAAFVPPSSAYTVLVNGGARAVSNVAVSGTTVTLTLASPVLAGDTVTLSYTPPT